MVNCKGGFIATYIFLAHMLEFFALITNLALCNSKIMFNVSLTVVLFYIGGAIFQSVN